jgi:hypothetical protein
VPAPVSAQLANSGKGPVDGVPSRPAGNAPELPVAAVSASSPARLTATAPTQPLASSPGQLVPAQLAAAKPPLRDASLPAITVSDRQIPPPGQQWSTAHLEVTEIFPPSAGSGWMAVVNGLPVMAGTMVEDAVVEEIRADRVLFLIQGKVVAVPLSKEH